VTVPEKRKKPSVLRRVGNLQPEDGKRGGGEGTEGAFNSSKTENAEQEQAEPH